MDLEILYDRGVKIMRIFSVVFMIIVVSVVSGSVAAFLVASKYAPKEAVTTVQEERIDTLKEERQSLDIKHQKEIEDYKRLVKNLREQIHVLTSKVTRIDDQVEAIRHEAPVQYTDRDLEQRMKALGLHGKVVSR